MEPQLPVGAVRDFLMLNRAIIPDQQIALSPGMPVREFDAFGVTKQVLQDGAAFFLRHADDLLHLGRRNIECLAACQRVFKYQPVCDRGILCHQVARFLLVGPVLGRVRVFEQGVYAVQRMDELLVSLRQALKGEGHVREYRGAPYIRDCQAIEERQFRGVRRE